MALIAWRLNLSHWRRKARQLTRFSRHSAKGDLVQPASLERPRVSVSYIGKVNLRRPQRRLIPARAPQHSGASAPPMPRLAVPRHSSAFVEWPEWGADR